MMARQGGKIFHELQADPHMIDVAVRDFSVLTGPTEVTRRRVLTDEPSTTGRAMSGTLRTLLAARAAAVVGRQAERTVLLDLAERDRPLVVAVHGIAGIGKSALLAAFAEDARAHGAAVVGLDCGAIEPTERGFLAVLARAIGALRAEPSGRTGPFPARVIKAADGAVMPSRRPGPAAPAARGAVRPARPGGDRSGGGRQGDLESVHGGAGSHVAGGPWVEGVDVRAGCLKLGPAAFGRERDAAGQVG